MRLFYWFSLYSESLSTTITVAKKIRMRVTHHPKRVVPPIDPHIHNHLKNSIYSSITFKHLHFWNSFLQTVCTVNLFVFLFFWIADTLLMKPLFAHITLNIKQVRVTRGLTGAYFLPLLGLRHYFEGTDIKICSCEEIIVVGCQILKFFFFEDFNFFVKRIAIDVKLFWGRKYLGCR